MKTDLSMKIPASQRKRALIIVDVQPGFLNDRNKFIVQRILELLVSTSYDLYVDTVFYADEQSLWQTQQHWSLPKNEETRTDSALQEVLASVHSIHLEKSTKSVFKGDKPLEKILKENGIREVHFVGLDTNDCILASAYESFDLGFLTYVIEECSQSSSSDELHEQALELLRHQCMTNHSRVVDKDIV